MVISISFSCTTNSDEQRPRFICSCEQNVKVQNFIEKSLKPSNNMSDEEMEDVIEQLFETGVKLNCNQRLMYIKSNGFINWERNKLDSCQTAYEYYNL